MKVKANRKKLLAAAERATKPLRRSSAASNLDEYFLMEVTLNSLTFHSYSATTYLETQCPDTVADEPFSCAFPYGQFLGTLKTVSNEFVTVEYDGGRILLSGGRVRLQIPCMDEKAWPKHLPLKDPDYEVSADELIPAFRECSHSLPDGETMDPVMRSYCVEQTNHGWKVTTLDGKRISIRGDVKETAKTQLLLDGQSLASILGIFDQEVQLALKDDQAVLYDSQTKVYLRTVTGVYYNIERMIQKPDYSVTVSRAEAIEAFSLALAILKSHIPAKMVMDTDADAIRVRASGSSTDADLDCEIAAEYEGDKKKAVPFGLNPRYVLDALKNIEGEHVTFQVNGVAITLEEEHRLEMICVCKTR